MSLSARDDAQTVPYPPDVIPPDAKHEYNAAEVSDEEEETSYPDGGLQAWLLVLGSFCGMYVTPKNPRSNYHRLIMVKASLLRLHEQHQHVQHLPVHTSALAL